MKKSYIAPELQRSALTSVETIADLVIDGGENGSNYDSYIDGLLPED